MISSRSEGRPATILVWLGGALGDTLFGYPALASLRRWAPRASITLVGRPSYAAFALSTGLIDQVVDIGGPSAASLFGGGSPSLEVPELAVVWSAAYAEIAARFEDMGTKAVIAASPRPGEIRHQARYLLDCLGPLGVHRALHPAPPPTLDALPPALQSLVPGDPGRTVLLHPGAGSAWKRWPLTAWITLAAVLANRGYAVRWSFGAEDEDLRSMFLGVAPEWRPITWPELPLAQYAALMARCALFVSSDTGVAHLAALLRVPQITLFGPTDPRRWRPLSRLAALVRAPNGHGCTWETDQMSAGNRPLRRCVGATGDHCACLEELSADAVLSACSRVLDEPLVPGPPAEAGWQGDADGGRMGR